MFCLLLSTVLADFFPTDGTFDQDFIGSADYFIDIVVRRYLIKTIKKNSSIQVRLTKFQQ